MSDYADIRQKLLDRRLELQARLAEIKSDVTHAEVPMPADFAEQAVERETEEVLDALGEAGEVELRAISKALARIESGDYGVCTGCGDPIPPKRLEVLPFSDKCVHCAETAAA